ncbi:DNA-binding transcriptional regulator CytR [Spirochaetia bacterium]|nr:DNA-binding transcriptional regulator CytR [Spirochaetia bacterium]
MTDVPSATILDVAKLAQVSPSTVTHALNGKRPVGRDTKKRILSAIDTLGYIPSHSASHLRKGKSGIIGCYTTDITEAFSNKIVRGIEQGLAGSGLSMLLVSGLEFGNDPSRAYRFLLSHNIEGLLLCYHIPAIFDIFKDTGNSKIPIISINMKLEGISAILPDNVSGGMIAADHLYASGMRHPAMICGPLDRISVEDRLQGFQGRVKELGLKFNQNYFVFGDYSYDHGYKMSYQLVNRDSKIDGIFCANDYIAAGAINRLTEMGYKIPDDIRIIGFDNRDFSQFWQIPISTFEQPLEKMGFMGISALRCLISTPMGPQEPLILQSRLIPRSSTIGHKFYKKTLEKV